ncbi:protein POLYCHOME-like [Salvia miltiorrhiza]|uniref:protein POLYCHOME-like n=1 Tax=Salvia miltiorrhiza TaxID=226208 RepID=UPI0025AD8278|nr:protein POLYCHOME-like [Salvia miltiorrhiza]XP_057768865.1 protein POLYCHOME-like [Salvia miltiorrhiza]
MPESRDRLSRQDSIIASYSRRRVSRAGDWNNGRGNPIAFVLEDDNEEGQNAGTPFRWRDTTMAGNPGSAGVAAGGAFGTPRIRPRNLSPVVGSGRSRGGAFGTPRIRRIARLAGSENLSPVVGSGRGGGGALPAWYPRRPLNDITAVVRAIERRRERGGDGEGLQTIQDRTSNDQASTPRAHLEHNKAMISPLLAFSNRCFPPSIGKVPKILLDITHHKGGATCLTPQKTLLNSIDAVEKVVMEELRKMKRTPSAKKAEREKRVRTLMSMR